VLSDIGASPVLRPNITPLLYNADYSVYQRTTSATGVATLAFHAPDRWRGGTDDGNDAGRLTIARDTDVPVGEGVKHSLKYTCTTVGTLTTDGWTELTQILEGNDLQAICKGTSNAKPLTLSVFVKSNLSGASNLITAILYDNDNARHVSPTAQITSANTWQQLIYNFPADTTGEFGMDNGASLYVQFLLGQGSVYSAGSLGTTWQANDAADYVSPNNMNLLSSTSNYINFAKAQLEIGEYTSSTLPPFQHESYHENFNRCKRYFQTLGYAPGDTIGGTNNYEGAIAGFKMGGSTSVNYGGEQFPVVMRASPTVTVYAVVSGSETAGKLIDFNTGADLGSATVSRIKANGYNYITSGSNSAGAVYRSVMDAEL
jgi:hypothetical protein